MLARVVSSMPSWEKTETSLQRLLVQPETVSIHALISSVSTSISLILQELDVRIRLQKTSNSTLLCVVSEP